MKDKKKLIENDKDKVEYIPKLPIILSNTINKVAIKNNVSTRDVEKILSSQFSLLKKVITSGKIDGEFEDYFSIRIRDIGSWKPSVYKFKDFQERFLRNREIARVELLKRGFTEEELAEVNITYLYKRIIKQENREKNKNADTN